MWVPGGMTAFLGGGLLSGSFWLCKSLMDAMLCGLGDEWREWRGSCGPGTRVLSHESEVPGVAGLSVEDSALASL